MATLMHVEAKGSWKTVDIPQDLLENVDFNNLIDIQVLTDYDLVQSDGSQKSKKKKRKLTVEDGTCDTGEGNQMSEGQSNSQPVKKKRKKKNQSIVNVQSEEGTDLGSEELNDNFLSKKSQKNVTVAKVKNKKKSSNGKMVAAGNVHDALESSPSEEIIVEPIPQPGKKKKRKQKLKKKKQENLTTQSSKSLNEAEDDDEEGGVAQPTLQKRDMSEWSTLFVPDELLSALEEQGFDIPTTIQKLVLPSAIRDRKDILGAAETGSGKTLAFGIPVLSKILHVMKTSHLNSKEEGQSNSEDESVEEGDEETTPSKPKVGSGCPPHPMALILEPTRELAVQVKNHLTRLAAHTDIKFVTVVGGMAIEKQRRILSKRPHVIIATPGRLWQLIEEGNEFLREVAQAYCLVVDEADRMVEKGHFEELTKLMEMLNKGDNCRKSRQTFVMSATLTMEVVAPKRLMNKSKKKKKHEDKLKTLTERICIGLKPKVIDLTPKAKVAQTLTELRVNCKAEEKDIFLYYFLVEHPGRTLVFVNSKDCLRRLVSVFTLLQCRPLPLHADMHQKQRLKNLDRFTANQTAVLLASDVAARGLDIPKVDHVIHYQVPRTMENYIHRSGRTARASNVGLSVMLVGPQEAKDYQKIVQGVKNGEDLPILPVDQDLLPAAKHRVDLAKSIDVTEYRIKKKKVRNNFFLKAAEEMDMIIDDKNLLEDLGDSSEQNDEKHRLAQMKSQLSATLTTSLAPLRMTKYPTKSGQLARKKVVNLYAVGS